ncbi:uncharacterized, partial [Tachysurus ichikawai]
QRESENTGLDADDRKFQQNDSGQNPTTKPREASVTLGTFRAPAPQEAEKTRSSEPSTELNHRIGSNEQLC